MADTASSLSIHAANSRIRVVSTHEIENSQQIRRNLHALVKNGDLLETRQREWEGGAYKFGADWLTPQALGVLGLGGAAGRHAAVEQFELRKEAFANRSIRTAVLFRGRDRVKRQFGEHPVVRLEKCGAISTVMDVVLVWVEVTLESDDPRVWLDFIGSVRHRVQPGEESSYLRRFVDPQETPLAFSDILLPVEEVFIGSAARGRSRSARNLFTFGRYKVVADSAAESVAFLREATRKARDTTIAPPVEASHDRDVGQLGDDAAITDACSLDALAIVLWQRPGEKEGTGAVAFRNAFHLGDLWLSVVVCMIQFQMMVSLERRMLELVGNLDSMATMRDWLPHVRGLVAVRNRYATVMSDFIQGYWRFGLVQIHAHERRHGVYLRLRQEMSLDQSLEAFHSKLDTLGDYVAEKQKDILGWFLIYAPFVSFLVGVFGINVKGFTSEEGIPPTTLLAWLAVLTILYAVCVSVLRLLLGAKARRHQG